MSLSKHFQSILLKNIECRSVYTKLSSIKENELAFLTVEILSISKAVRYSISDTSKVIG